MTQRHVEQQGTFHITTNTHGKIPWCTWRGVPEILIQELMITKELYDTKVFAFCVMPNHVHLIISPGSKGLSPFMQSFKSNSMRRIHRYLTLLRSGEPGLSATGNLVREPRLRERGVIKWQKGFHDERIRDLQQRHAAMNYVHFNAFKDGLSNDSIDWPWTSLHYPHVIDPFDLWI